MPHPDAWKIDLHVLERSWRAWATADLILCEQAWLRIYTFDAYWARGQSLGKVDNGGGDKVCALFTPAGTAVRGFDHESKASRYARDDFQPWPGIYDGMHQALREALNDPALEPEDVTFCLWRGQSDAHWWRGLELPPGVNDGSDHLLSRLFSSPDEYREWAEDYYERPVDLDAVALLLTGAVITPDLIGRLDPERDAEAVMDELTECGLIAPNSRSFSPPES